MRKMQLPDGAIRQKMATNGMSAADTAVFFGEAVASKFRSQPGFEL
jgi:hypothetical protein